MSGTSSQVLNPPSLFQIYIQVLNSQIHYKKFEEPLKKLLSESSKFSIYSHFSRPYIGTAISYIYLFIKYSLYFYNGYLEV